MRSTSETHTNLIIAGASIALTHEMHDRQGEHGDANDGHHVSHKFQRHGAHAAESMDVSASAEAAARATTEVPQQPDVPIDSMATGAITEGAISAGPMQPASTGVSRLPDAGAAGKEEDGTAQRPETMAAVATEGLAAQQQEPEPHADAKAAPEHTEGVHMTGATSVAHKGAKHAAVAKGQGDSAAGGDGGSDDFASASHVSADAAEEAAAAVQVAARGIGKSKASVDPQAGKAEVAVQPNVVPGSPGGVSDEDLAAEAAEARKRHQLQ